MLLNEQGKLIHKTHQPSQCLRAGSRAVIGTSVNASWWRGQTEPDGSIPSGSSVQSTCINEHPEAGRATRHVHACVFICACVNLSRPALTSCCKLLPVDSGVFLLCLYAACPCSLPPGFNPCLHLCACVCVSVYTWVHMCVLCLSPTVPSWSRPLYPLNHHY